MPSSSRRLFRGRRGANRSQKAGWAFRDNWSHYEPPAPVFVYKLADSLGLVASSPEAGKQEAEDPLPSVLGRP